MDMPTPASRPDAGDGEDGDRGGAPLGAVAAALVEAAAMQTGGLVHVAGDERGADLLAEIARAFAPDLQVLAFPPWDCLPYDRASPSAATQGARMACLLALQRPPRGGRLVLTSPEALIQRCLPPSSLQGGEHEVGLDRAGEVDAIVRFARRTGYREQDEVTEPGELAVRGEVLDVFPPASPLPCRLEIEDGQVRALHAFDPLTQLTTEVLNALTLTPASELIAPETDPDPPGTPRPSGLEHDLPRLAGPLDTLIDHAPDAALSLAAGAQARLDSLADQIASAFEAAEAVARDRKRAPPPRPDALYLDREGVAAALGACKRLRLDVQASPTPLFALSARPLRDAAEHVTAVVEAGGVAVLAGAPGDLKRLAREIERRDGPQGQPVQSWAEVRQAKGGVLLHFAADLDRGFESETPRLSVVTAQDVLGTRARHAVHATPAALLETEPDLRFGDLVIHEDHGVGTLKGLETVEAAGARRATARLEYHDGAALLVPAAELRHVWRYGSAADVVALDRLNTQGWAKKRAQVEASIAQTARELVELARARDAIDAPEIVPPRQAYERFVSRFPYPPTDDQVAAIDAILQDLRAGRPMNRLVCGDVGFGKTEVALRAAAAVALSGRQVALAAPTTVLARQHLATFERRFAPLGLKVGHLSRLAQPAEVRATKAGLESGDIQLVVGTHALAAKDVRFKDLGLLIIDEEQRFGAKLKAELHALAPQAHVLTLTATPIPRTLQSALVGLQDVSVIATPPARRRPVRTLLSPHDPATVKTALERERARGGQSFVVTPRIEDIEPLRAELAGLVPGLTVLVAHGELPAQEVDEVMVRFADGDGDVLLATNIIESGLDVPRANTMIVHHPDRFGLAQLHQLRGRVGRGRAQASAYLLYDPAHPLSDVARDRLQTLVAYDRLGAGLAISARDLDLRGAGDLVGEDQAGHLKLIGIGLYQWLLERAVRQARDEPVDDRPEPELALSVSGELPEGYVPDPEVRLNLYARLSRLTSGQAVQAFAHELEDRFGPLPGPATTLLELTRIGRLARELGVLKLSAGPKGVALDLYDSATARRLAEGRGDLVAHDQRLVWARETADDGERLDRLADLLDSLQEP